MEIDEYIQQVMRLATAAGGDPNGVERYAFDLEAAVKKSTSDDIAIAHTLHFLRGVGAYKFFDVANLKQKDLMLDLEALPRAYIPLDCANSQNEADSLQKNY